MPNIAKNFIQSFDSGYDASARNFEENLRQKQSEEYQTQKEERERQAKLKEKQDTELQSQKNITSYQNAKPEDKAKSLLGLSKDDLAKVKDINELTKPKANQKTIGKQVFQTDASGNIDFTKPYIFVSNHASIADIPTVMVALNG